MRSRSRGALACIFACGWFLGGCVAGSYSEQVPYNFDLSGTWELLPEASDSGPDLEEIASSELEQRSRGRNVDPLRSNAFLAQDSPVVVAETLEIEQDERSVGIAFDNGFYREYDWGKQRINDWDVVSGFEDGELRVTMNRKRNRLSESYELAERNTRLIVTVVSNSSGKHLRLRRVYSRAE